MTQRYVTGWKLEASDRARLLLQFSPLFADVVADHVTLRTGTTGETPLPSEAGGEIVGEIDDSEGVQVLIVRIGGTTRREDGSTYHITWSLDRAKGRRAVESNAVIARLGWRPLHDPVAVLLTPAHFLFG